MQLHAIITTFQIPDKGRFNPGLLVKKSACGGISA